MASRVRESDVPSPIDFCDPVAAGEWARTAQSRPGRAEMFRAFAAELDRIGRDDLKVLEIGSGPGFLAELLLNEFPALELWLLDFSPAMHALARARLGDRADRTRDLRRNFTDPAWAKGLETFDAVISNQSVHELRHKRHAPTLHAQVATTLKPGAPYLICDHFCGEGGMTDDRLYMTEEEHRQALVAAGFESVVLIARSGSLVMYRAA